VVAVGGAPATPSIRGIEGRKVLSGAMLKRTVAPYLRLFGPALMNRLTRLWLPVGKNVVVIGGLLHGCQVAAFLVKRGRKVTIAESSEELGEGTPVALKPRLLDWLVEKGTTMLAGVEYLEITKDGLMVKTGKGSTQVLAADTVLTALPLEPNLALAKALEGKVPELYPIGDCIKPQQILQAIEDGSRVGHAI
jgi:2,4-dienoyl-CoA reductase (NADPH2)